MWESRSMISMGVFFPLNSQLFHSWCTGEGQGVGPESHRGMKWVNPAAKTHLLPLSQ
jgi:hypothetical protein